MAEEGPKRATVICRVKDLDGTKVVRYHRNPLMDAREHDLEYDDWTHGYYFANVISENLYSHVDSEGHQFLVLKEIYYHWSYVPDIFVDDEFIISRGGNKH